jgi:translation initiation factor RLI1
MCWLLTAIIVTNGKACKWKQIFKACTQFRFAYVPAVVQQNSIVEVVGSNSCGQATVSGLVANT